MKFFTSWFQKFDKSKSVIVTIGNFDGFHKGHEKLLQVVRKDSAENNKQGLVVFFDPHPRSILGGTPLARITPFEEYPQYIKKAGLHGYMKIDFNQQLIQSSPEQFFTELYQAVPFSKIWIGEDFYFGKDRSGNIAFLKQIAQKHNVDVSVFPNYKLSKYKVSSSTIRSLLAEGKFKEAANNLGRYWHFEGVVENGEQLARKLGFPTLNLEIPFRTPLSYGVYIALIQIESNMYQAVCNFGMKPTIQYKKILWESHILNYTKLPEVQKMKIMPLAFLRKEKKFESLELLKEQIVKDKEQAQLYFHENKKLPQFTY